MGLIVYGDFNCPFSALASHRVDHIATVRAGLDVEFRAVEHSPRIPPDGLAMVGKRRDDMTEEVAEVLGLVRDDEPQLDLRVPDALPNTAAMCQSYASAPADDLRRALFAAVWAPDPDGAVVGAPDTTGSDRLAGWQQTFDAIDRDDKTVPTLVLDDGTVIRGRDALTHLVTFFA